MDRKLCIAICEDIPEDMGRLYRQLEALGTSMELHRFESGEAFLERFTAGRYHLVFLDIYMGGMPGTEVARTLRAQDERCVIVFTTTSRDHAFEGYRVGALQYLLKPTAQKDVAQVVAQAQKLLAPEAVAYCTVLVEKRERSVPLKSILYTEVYNHTCLIHTAEETISAYVPIGELEKMLPNPPFLRCHQAYIVNMDCIERVEQDFCMKNGDRVYIRQRDHRKMRDAYMRHIVRKLKEIQP